MFSGMSARSLRLWASIWIWAAIVPAGWSQTTSPVSFKGETITMVIGYAPGGSTDVVGRLIGKYLVKYLPGEPNLVVQNMPGAEGVTSVNYLVKQTAPDGLTITAAAAAQIDPLFYPTAHAVYRPLDLEYIGGTGRPGSVMLISENAVSRLTDENAAPVVMGAPAAVRSAMQMVIWGGAYLGWNLRWVVGYPGSNDLRLALERGEIDTTTLATLSDISDVMRSGRFRILLQSGFLDHGKLVKRPEFGDAPLFSDLMAGKVDEPVARQALAYTNGMTQIGQWFALPPHTPDTIVATYRTAYERLFHDPQFQAEIDATAPGVLEMTDADVVGIVKELDGTSPDVLAYLQSMAKRQGLAMSP